MTITPVPPQPTSSPQNDTVFITVPGKASSRHCQYDSLTDSPPVHTLQEPSQLGVSVRYVCGLGIHQGRYHVAERRQGQVDLGRFLQTIALQSQACRVKHCHAPALYRQWNLPFSLFTVKLVRPMLTVCQQHWVISEMVAALIQRDEFGGPN